MNSAAEYRRPVSSDGEAMILNALPNPVLLIGPDGKIVDANMAAESFFEISTQFLQRQLLKELVPFGSPLLALIDQVRSSGSPVNEYKVDLGTPRMGGDRQTTRVMDGGRTRSRVANTPGVIGPSLASVDNADSCESETGEFGRRNRNCRARRITASDRSLTRRASTSFTRQRVPSTSRESRGNQSPVLRRPLSATL